MKRTMALAAAIALGVAMPAQAEMGGYGISSIRMAVKDDAREMEFLKILGMKVGRLHHPGQQEMTWEKPGIGPAIILMHKDDSVALMPGSMSFVMFVPDAAATARALRAAGFPGITDPKPGTGSFIEHSVKDPEGNVMLLIAPNPNAARK